MLLVGMCLLKLGRSVDRSERGRSLGHSLGRSLGRSLGHSLGHLLALALALALSLAQKVHAGPVRRSRRVAGEAADGAENAGDVWNYEAAEVVYNEEKYSLRHVEGLSSVGGGGTPWVLFQDGYDAKGNRLYDKAAGMTCHQCRQKTLGKRTSCSGCGSLHGVFCGDCLWMRYGEHVDEVMEGGGAGWVCPPCRDLCNCSFCRSRKGWCPTGTLYRRVVAEGWVVDLWLCLAVSDDGDAVVHSLTRSLACSGRQVQERCAFSGHGVC